MDQSRLAILGGNQFIQAPFENYQSIGEAELRAASSVIKSGVLSQFVGDCSKDFYGGPKVQEFEKKCADYFGVKHAITVNSWTSGLIAAVGAIGISPGDEIIVSPWTMCASATAIVHWNAIPIFADIDPETFNLDPNSVIRQITPRTRAIMAIDIFGQSCDVDSLRAIANKYSLKLILDTAQAPGAIYKGSFAGTKGDVGGYSLNYHKHIHTGEGGIVVTDDAHIAERVKLIRNHAEAVVKDKGVKDLSNMIGHNFRLGEIECAIGIEQLSKLDKLIETRQVAAAQLTKGLSNLSGIKTPSIASGNTHVYYVYGMVLDIEELGVSRARLAEALACEGVSGLMQGYANVHLLPMYQQKQAYGSFGFPWTADFADKSVNYDKGICPVAEKLHDETFLGLEMCLFNYDKKSIELLIGAFQKVWKNLDKL